VYAYLTESQDRNRAGAILAIERFQTQLAPFVKRSSRRLAYVETEVLRIIAEVVNETGGDYEYIDNRLRAAIADAVLAPSFEKFPIEPPFPEGQRGGNPLEKAIKGEGWQPDATTDIYDLEPVLDEEARTPDAKVDLGDSTAPDSGVGERDYKTTAYSAEDAGDPKDESTWKPCFRCQKGLNPVVAQFSPVCSDCTEELTRHSVDSYDTQTTDATLPPAQTVPNPPVDSEIPYKCNGCERAGQEQVFPTKKEALEHAQSCPNVQELMSQTMYARRKLAQPPMGGPPPGGAPPGGMPNPNVGPTPQPAPQAPQPQEPVQVGEGLDSSPSDQFEDVVKHLAERTTAIQHSTPPPDLIKQLAQRYGLDEHTLGQSLKIIATIGDVTAVNGQIGGDESTDGLQEITDVDGHISNQEVQVPSDLAIGQVAEDTGTNARLVQQMVQDHFGGVDLPDQFHTSVSGQVRYFLPPQMTGVQEGNEQEAEGAQ
jgi:hypothetical protein